MADHAAFAEPVYHSGISKDQLTPPTSGQAKRWRLPASWQPFQEGEMFKSSQTPDEQRLLTSTLR